MHPEGFSCLGWDRLTAINKLLWYTFGLGTAWGAQSKVSLQTSAGLWCAEQELSFSYPLLSGESRGRAGKGVLPAS